MTKNKPYNNRPPSERRKYARLDLALTVSYAVMDRHGTPIDPRDALTSDISAGGLRLMTPTALEPGTPLDLGIYIAEESQPIKADGDVVWQTKITDTSYETGVVIRHMKDADKKRFMEFVFDQMAKMVTGG